MKEDTLRIEVEIKSVYGKYLLYPICEKAKIFADLVGTKTLSARDIGRIKKLGYTVFSVSERIGELNLAE